MTSIELDPRELGYLLGRVRGDISTRRKYLDRFRPSPGVPEDEVAAYLKKLRDQLEFRERLCARLQRQAP